MALWGKEGMGGMRMGNTANSSLDMVVAGMVRSVVKDSSAES